MVNLFPWSEAFAVGDADLDEEHRCIVGLVNQICAEAGAGQHAKAVSLLSELQFVAEAHFRHEEALLHRIETEIDQQHLRTVIHNAIEDHASAHRLGLEVLLKLLERARAASSCEGSGVCQDLKSWFVEHAVGEEAQVKTILQSTRHLAELS